MQLSFIKFHGAASWWHQHYFLNKIYPYVSQQQKKCNTGDAVCKFSHKDYELVYVGIVRLVVCNRQSQLLQSQFPTIIPVTVFSFYLGGFPFYLFSFLSVSHFTASLFTGFPFYRFPILPFPFLPVSFFTVFQFTVTQFTVSVFTVSVITVYQLYTN